MLISETQPLSGPRAAITQSWGGPGRAAQIQLRTWGCLKQSPEIPSRQTRCSGPHSRSFPSGLPQTAVGRPQAKHLRSPPSGRALRSHPNLQHPDAPPQPSWIFTSPHSCDWLRPFKRNGAVSSRQWAGKGRALKRACALVAHGSDVTPASSLPRPLAVFIQSQAFLAARPNGAAIC